MSDKNLQVFLYVFMVVCIFAVAGCEYFSPGVNPVSEETPTPSPVLPVDTSCPAILNTVVREVYDAEHPGAFTFVITFDEFIESGCIEDPSKWIVEVRTSGGEKLTTENGDIEVYEVTVDGEKVTVTAQVMEGSIPSGRYRFELRGCAVFDEYGNFCCSYSGSICYTKPTCEVCVEECPLGGSICD